jgi:hypothetical protein
MKRLVTGLCALALPLLAAAPASALSFSNKNGVLLTCAHAFETVDIDDCENPGWAGTPAPLTGAAFAGGSGFDGKVSTFNNMSATWSASGLSGTITLQDGWTMQESDLANHDLEADFNPSTSIWSYAFVPNQLTNFVLNFNISRTGDATGFAGYSILVDNEPLIPLFGVGQFGDGLAANKLHIIQIFNPSQLNGSPGASHTGHENGSLNFLFTAIGSAAPEPATWALMLGGFGLAGAALRRRAATAA